MTDLTPLQNLIAQWDALADAAWRKGDDQQEPEKWFDLKFRLFHPNSEMG
jgi:hypothetical protein